MIQSNELRIGNWVYDVGNTPVQVIRITKDKLALETPIPLSAEILEKAGFVSDIDHWYNSPGHEIRILFHDKGVTVCTQSVVRPVNYLHQLQNLYFALTGEELPVEL